MKPRIRHRLPDIRLPLGKTSEKTQPGSQRKRESNSLPSTTADQQANALPPELRRPQIYEGNNWICACDVTNKLFCFPCLLFAKESDASWVKTGVCDLSHLTQKIKKHEEYVVHKNATLDLSMLGKTDIRQQLDTAFRRNIERHNDVVRKKSLGIWDVFDPRRSDLSGMSNDPDLYVRNIEQAVTVVIRNYVKILDIQTRTMAARATIERFVVTHPFLYFVLDTDTHVALMAGKIVDPLNSRIY
ncbi:hypothetical protein ANN_17464 [Periplaneta americana]|uniref:Serpin domain-containing protein n=1 Tax=Periplaneta americana TaxID=6978 RepID=A0ABQ8SUB5_PERAM|nr:hypothetical protein ANN_17464 [Periplaneta americana]